MTEAGTGGSSSGREPLRPDATIDEIQARVSHLSAESAPDGDQIEPSVAPAPEAPAPKAKRTRLLGGLGAVGIGLVILVAKVGFKLLAVGVAATALSGAFGSRYDQLPANQRQSFEQRYDAALGTSLDNLSDKDRSARMSELVTHGAARLDDPSLVLWTQLDARAAAATDTKTCAEIARGWFTKGADQATVSAAVAKSYESLSTDDYGAVLDLDLKAIEAETAGTPAVRSVTDAAMEPVFGSLDAFFATADGQTIDAMSSGTAATDEAACSALRNLQSAAATLPTDQFAVWAVWTSVP